MKTTIRAMKEADRSAVLEMMKVFYESDAVHTNGSAQIFEADFENCINGSPYLAGYIFEGEGEILGYAMIARSFSTEFGKPCIWIEDLYLKEDFRGLGLGSAFFKQIERENPGCLFRLEVEAENERAVAVYRKNGYEVLPYMEMKK